MWSGDGGFDGSQKTSRSCAAHTSPRVGGRATDNELVNVGKKTLCSFVVILFAMFFFFSRCVVWLVCPFVCLCCLFARLVLFAYAVAFCCACECVVCSCEFCFLLFFCCLSVLLFLLRCCSSGQCRWCTIAALCVSVAPISLVGARTRLTRGWRTLLTWGRWAGVSACPCARFTGIGGVPKDNG